MGAWLVGPYIAHPRRVTPFDSFELCPIRFNWKKVRGRGVTLFREGGRVVDFVFNHNNTLQDRLETHLQYAGFNTGSYWYACTPESIRGGALKRLFSCRENELTHVQLVMNQMVFAGTNPGLKAFKKFFASRVKKDDEYFNLLDKWVEAPHPKRQLRVRTRDKLRSRGLEFKDQRSYTDYKAKPGELLAPGKQLRAIGEISDESAFEHGPLADLQKKVFAEDFIYRGCRACFIPGPKPEHFDKMRDRLLSPTYKLEFFFFSDDSCLAIKCKDRVFWANLDFSASDGSMFTPEFEYAIDVLCADRVKASKIRSAFIQCMKKIKVFNRGGRPRDHTSKLDFIEVKLKEGQFCLPSGFSGTTLMNNFSEIFFFCSLADALERRRYHSDRVPDIIERAANKAGFIIKVQKCEYFEDFQFLKHSWGLTPQGEYKPYVNLACWIRGFGILKNFLQVPKGVTLKEKCDLFSREIVKSRENWGRHVLSEAFSQVYPPVENIVHDLGDELKKTQISEVFDIQQVSLERRYRLRSGQLDEFCDLLRSNLAFGVHIHHPCVSAFMQKDYGYSSNKGAYVNWKYTTGFVYKQGRKFRDLRGIVP